MSASAIGRHLFISKDGPTGVCEQCGGLYDIEIHKQFFGPKSLDLHHMKEDDRIELIASKVREGQIIAVLLESGIGKVERYIEKLKTRHPDVRLINRTLLSGMVESVQFGPKVQV